MRKWCAAPSRTVTTGEVVALCRMPVPEPFDTSDKAVRLDVYYGGPDRTNRATALDTIALSPHGLDITHVDALGHSFYEGRAYNGRNVEDLVGPRGLAFCGMDAMDEGIVTRGVLLDVARSRGVERLEATDGITGEDLTDAGTQRGDRASPWRRRVRPLRHRHDRRRCRGATRRAAWLGRPVAPRARRRGVQRGLHRAPAH